MYGTISTGNACSIRWQSIGGITSRASTCWMPCGPRIGGVRSVPSGFLRTSWTSRSTTFGATADPVIENGTPRETKSPLVSSSLRVARSKEPMICPERSRSWTSLSAMYGCLLLWLLWWFLLVFFVFVLLLLFLFFVFFVV